MQRDMALVKKILKHVEDENPQHPDIYSLSSVPGVYR